MGIGEWDDFNYRPKQNRNVPPLRYEDVYRLKREFPELEIEINGGIKQLDDFERHLEQVDAVMIGRVAYDNPTLFAGVDKRFFGVQERDIGSDWRGILCRHQYQPKNLIRLKH